MKLHPSVVAINVKEYKPQRCNNTKNAVKWQLVVVITNLYRKIVTLKTIPTDAVKAFITGINNERFHFS
jgi:hypothetical protein